MHQPEWLTDGTYKKLHQGRFRGKDEKFPHSCPQGHAFALPFWAVQGFEITKDCPACLWFNNPAEYEAKVTRTMLFAAHSLLGVAGRQILGDHKHIPDNDPEFGVPCYACDLAKHIDMMMSKLQKMIDKSR